MTALAFIVGCLPLWAATGSGAASRRILGTVVVGGMTLSTVLGLIFIPVTFAVVEFLSHRFVRGGKGTTMDSICGPEPLPASQPVDRRARPHRRRSGMMTLHSAFTTQPARRRIVCCRGLQRRPKISRGQMSRRRRSFAAQMKPQSPATPRFARR